MYTLTSTSQSLLYLPAAAFFFKIWLTGRQKKNLLKSLECGKRDYFSVSPSHIFISAVVLQS